jgi:hypothetical protein
MIGEAWIVLAILALVGALTETHIRKPVVLICGLALLLELPTWVHLMGWFIGNEILAIAGSLIVVGGLLFHNRSAV